MTEAPRPFAPGDRLRVIVDEPYSTDLKTNDLVTVLRLTVDVNEQLVYVVSTAYGTQYLYPDVVQLFTDDAYKPAEPDDVTDAHFRAIMSTDPELMSLGTDADTAFGANEAQLSDQLGGGTAVAEEEKMPGWTKPEAADHFHFTDPEGEELDVYYAEQTCPEHGREGAFFIQLNDDDDDVVIVPADLMPRLILFLHNRTMFSRRPQEGES